MSESPTNLAPAGPPRAALIIVWLLGALMVVSALAKLRELGPFEALLTQVPGLGDRQVAAWAARLVVLVELSLGLGLFQAAWRRRVLLPATLAVLGAFSLYLIIQMARGAEGNCGCFGTVLAMSHGAALVKNLLALAAGGWAFTRLPRPTGESATAPLLLAAFSLALVLVAFPVTAPVVVPVAGNGEPVAAAPSPLARFVSAEMPLTEGDALVAFLSLDCEHCQAAASLLAERQGASQQVPTYFLFLGEAEMISEFFQKTGPVVPHKLIGPKDFFAFVEGAPPALYLLRGGQVRKVWQGKDFTLEALAAALR